MVGVPRLTSAVFQKQDFLVCAVNQVPPLTQKSTGRTKSTASGFNTTARG
jgi:hypothetical protein